ncbi:MAG: aspartyl protease family protein [Candidatus Azotimanducaceae bacterium]|jgi:aspartyl protease family protein
MSKSLASVIPVFIRIEILAAALLVASNIQALEIEVLGLFKNAALVRIDGERKLLKQGVVSGEGVELIQADSEGATFVYNDERIELSLSSKISTRFEQPASSMVQIVGRNNQFKTSGSINGQSVGFLIDTGATVVAMNQNHAISLGIDYEKGKVARVETAGGVINAHQVFVDSMTVGSIRAANVEVAILEGNHPSDILLGMSFLQHVEIQKSKGLMTLVSKI